MDLKTICELPGISGREEPVRKAIYDEFVEKLGKENVIIDRAGNVTPHVRTYQLGRAMTVSDGICWMDGLADIMYGEVVEFECGERGISRDHDQRKRDRRIQHPA